MVTVGSLSPAWTSVDQDGATRSSSEYRGKWLLLYFYPKDDTPGCTIEACGFRDAWCRLSSLVHILGVSSDSSESHRKFITKYSLPFPLLADTDGALRAMFKADGTQYPKRVTFLIRPSGHIEKVYEGFDCNNHASTIERDLTAFLAR
jgi:peroxiredoxin Q/BCP